MVKKSLTKKGKSASGGVSRQNTKKSKAGGMARDTQPLVRPRPGRTGCNATARAPSSTDQDQVGRAYLQALGLEKGPEAYQAVLEDIRRKLVVVN